VYIRKQSVPSGVKILKPQYKWWDIFGLEFYQFKEQKKIKKVL
jgi:hypothetical protein